MPDWKALDETLARWAEEGHIAGFSACILGPEGEAYTRCGGVINKEGRNPDPDTVYGIASLSKSLTALCACILQNKAAGLYDGAYKVVRLAMGLKGKSMPAGI